MSLAIAKPNRYRGVERRTQGAEHPMAPFGIRRVVGAAVAIFVGSGVSARAADCPVAHGQLAQALRASVKASGGPSNGGFENHEWASVVARDGTVCAVAFSGSRASDQWPGSRAIAMEKATTANAFSLKAMALSTANLFALAQPGQSLYGIVTASPPSPEVDSGDAAMFGTANDPMMGKRPGGVIVFGGGLPLYNGTDIVGGLGVSGDS